MKLIKLTRGFFASVDDDDFESLSGYSWQALRGRNTWYAKRALYNPVTKNNASILMHQMILPSSRVDHIDGCGLNNKRSNLRAASNTENVRSAVKANRDTSSVYKGVSWSKRRSSWRAYIVLAGKQKHLGSFDDEQKAAIAYDIAARKYFGKFAKPNFL